MKYLAALTICLVFLLGCSEPAPEPNIAGRTEFSPSLEPLIGEWDAEDGFALIVSRSGDEIMIDNPPNETVRYEISNVSSQEGSISFTQHHKLTDGSYNAFGDVPCKCTISTVAGDPDSLRFTISIPQTPGEIGELYSRRK